MGIFVKKNIYKNMGAYNPTPVHINFIVIFRVHITPYRCKTSSYCVFNSQSNSNS